MLSSNCLKFFVGLSLTAALILPSYVYFFLSPHFCQLLVDNREKEAERVCSHLISSFIQDSKNLADGAIYQRLASNETRIKHDFQLKEFKFFSNTGQTLYSSDPAEIGNMNSTSYFTEIVGQGNSYSKLVEEGSRTLGGKVVSVSVVHTYVPIMEDGSFAGAFGIYSDITPVKARFDTLMAKVYSVLTVIAGVMILLVCFSFCKANKAIAEKKLLDDEKDKNFQTEVIFNKLFQLSLVKASLEEILEIFICHLTTFPGIALEPKGAVFLVEESSKPLKLAALWGLDPELLSTSSRELFGTCVCGGSADEGDCFFGQSSAEEHHIQPAALAPHGHYCIPIHSSQGGLLGVFTLYPKGGGDQSDRTEKILLAAANLIAGIIERKQLEEKLCNISITDELTGLFNRRGFRTLAQQELDLAERQHETMAVFYIDLDGLKQINDRHGHNAGDQAIQDTAEILKETFRAADIIARIGGDEFAVFGSFAPETGSHSVLRWRLAEGIRNFNSKKEKPYAISCSVGVSYIIPEGPETLDLTLSQADSAMYAEKRKKHLEQQWAVG
ncbi:MAG: sensor domain-containing diguanylate cyclase [Thermodesulfobacteriota bacterium]